MAERLTPSASRGPWPRRTGLALLVAALVLALHAGLGQLLWHLETGGDRHRFPERLAVVFLQELRPQAVASVPDAARAGQSRRPEPEPAITVPGPALAASEAPVAAQAEPAASAADAAASPERRGSAASEPLAEPLPEVAQVASGSASASASALASAAESSTEPGPEWPLSTQLRYRLSGNYRGEVTGEAEVQWLRQGARYQVHLEVLVGARFAPLIQRRMSSDGLLGAAGISPHRYEEDTRMLMRERRRVALRFDRQARQLYLADGSPQPLPEGVQDAASQFVQLTWLFLTGRERLAPGHIVSMPLALPRRLYAWRYEVLGEDLLDTPMGPVPAWHLRPLLDRELRPQDLKAEVWLAPSLQYLPLRLRIAQDEQTYLDLMLKAPPLQAAQ